MTVLRRRRRHHHYRPLCFLRLRASSVCAAVSCRGSRFAHARIRIRSRHGHFYSETPSRYAVHLVISGSDLRIRQLDSRHTIVEIHRGEGCRKRSCEDNVISDNRARSAVIISFRDSLLHEPRPACFRKILPPLESAL